MLADADVPHDLDWQGISQFFTFGHYFNDDTSLSAVKVVPAGAALTFECAYEADQASPLLGGRRPRLARVSTDRQAAFDEVDEALFDAVRKRSIVRRRSSWPGALRRTRRADDPRRDSNEPAERLQSVCLGMAGSRDHQASTQLAAIVGCPHRSHILDDRFLADFRRHLEAMVRLTDGQYLSQCIVMPTFSLYQELGVGVLLRGHGGELMHMSKAYNYSARRRGIAAHE